MREDIDEKAAHWHLLQAHDDMDWHGFTAWLEADPRHREAYDAIALLDERIASARPHLAALADEPEPEAARRNLARVAGWSALAAGMVAAFAATIVNGPSPHPGAAPAQLAFDAPAGQVRTVQLAEGMTASIAPGSALRVSTRNAPIELDGNAYFNIRHDADHPVTITAGDYQIRDIGTQFEIMSGSGMLRVAVSSGSVAVRPRAGGSEIQVGRGQVLTLVAGGPADLREIRGNEFASWRRGPLVYDDVPLGLVAANLSRYGGKSVRVDPAIANRRFSGVIAPGSQEAMTAALAELTGLHARTEGDAIRLGNGAGG